MRYFFLTVLLLAVMVVGIAGFRGEKFHHTPLELIPDMDQQPKVKPQGSNFFFADGQGARKPIAGTVPMGLSMPTGLASQGYTDPNGFSHGSDYYNTGKMENGTRYGDGFPEQVKVDEALLRLGQERYNIHCFICHGKSGNGKGMLSLMQIPDDPMNPEKVKASWGIANIANFHDARFSDTAAVNYASNGSIFSTITNGFGLMGRYGDKINVHERWAIVAYVRTLILSRKAPLSDPKVKELWESALASGKAAKDAPAAPATPGPEAAAKP